MSQIEIKSDVITNKEINSFKPFKKETESILNYDSIRQNEKKRKKFVNNFKYQKFSFFNFFLFEIMFFVLQIVSQENYIKLTVPNSGEQQIFSDKYALSENGFSKIKINGRTKILRDKKVSLDRPNSNVIIEWSKTITDFTYMFANIESISSITIKCMSLLRSLIQYSKKPSVAIFSGLAKMKSGVIFRFAKSLRRPYCF